MSDVVVTIYDLSQGMASQFSAGLLGKTIDGIWHTGVIVYGREYYFGGGICADAPGATPYGMPVRTEKLGRTNKTQEEFLEFLSSISSKFTFATYDLFENNCNNFSDACAMYLVKKHIPQYILDLPNEALDSPMGPMLRSMLQSAQGAIRDQSAGHELSLPNTGMNAGNTTTSNATTSTPTNAQTPQTKSATQVLWRTAATQGRANRTAVISKLQEFTTLKGDEEYTALLKAVKELSVEKAFPALDLLRLSVLQSDEAALALAGELDALVQKFCTDSAPVARASFMMTTRCAVNVFHSARGEAVAMSAANRAAFIECAYNALHHSHKAVRLSGALLAANIAGAPARHTNISQLEFGDAARIIEPLATLLAPDAEVLPPEVASPAVSALAILVDEDPEAVQLATVFEPDVKRHAGQIESADVKTAVSIVSQVINSA